MNINIRRLNSSQMTRTRQPVCGHPARALQGRLRQAKTPSAAYNEVAGQLAGLSPYGGQEVLVGGVVIAAIASSLIAGLQKEPVVCDLCQGNGGTRCFACSGEGKMPQLISRDELIEGKPKRDMLGRSGNDRNCKICKGAGLIGCSKCKGSGYA